MRTAHIAHDEYPERTICGEPWEPWQHPDQGATDAEIREHFGERELALIRTEERARGEPGMVRQCQACFKRLKEAV